MKAMRVGIRFLLHLSFLCALACSSSLLERGKESATGKTTVQPSAASTAPAIAPPATDLALAAVRKLATVHSFRASLTTTGTRSESMIAKMDVVLPDRFHIVSSKYELISVGTDTYLKLPDQEWRKSSSSLDITNLTDPKKLEAYLSTAIDIVALSPGMLDGATVHIYQAKFRHPPTSKSHMMSQPFSVQLWVGEADGRLRMLEGKPAHSLSTTTVVYYDYDARLNVVVPVK